MSDRIVTPSGGTNHIVEFPPMDRLARRTREKRRRRTGDVDCI
jgi:hypothetical protein